MYASHCLGTTSQTSSSHASFDKDNVTQKTHFLEQHTYAHSPIFVNL